MYVPNTQYPAQNRKQNASHVIDAHDVEGPSSFLGFDVVRDDFGCW